MIAQFSRSGKRRACEALPHTSPKSECRQSYGLQLERRSCLPSPFHSGACGIFIRADEAPSADDTLLTLVESLRLPCSGMRGFAEHVSMVIVRPTAWFRFNRMHAVVPIKCMLLSVTNAWFRVKGNRQAGGRPDASDCGQKGVAEETAQVYTQGAESAPLFQQAPAFLLLSPNPDWKKKQAEDRCLPLQ